MIKRTRSYRSVGTATRQPKQATSSENWMQKYDLKTGDLLIALPIIHLVLTTSYLFFYGAVFGSGVRELLSSADLVNAAIRQMPLLYFTYLLALSLSLSFPIKRNTKPKNKAKGKQFALIIALGLMFIAYLILILGIWRYTSGIDHFFNPQFALPAWLFTWSFLSLFVLYRMKIDNNVVLLIGLLVVALSIATFYGGADAQRQKYARFSDPEHPRSICGDAEVLATISDKILVVRRDGSKAIYTTDCELSLTLPTPKHSVKKRRKMSVKQAQLGEHSPPTDRYYRHILERLHNWACF